MNTRRMISIRLEEGRVEKKVHHQVEHVEQDVEGDQVPIGGQGNEFPVVHPEMMERLERF